MSEIEVKMVEGNRILLETSGLLYWISISDEGSILLTLLRETPEEATQPILLRLAPHKSLSGKKVRGSPSAIEKFRELGLLDEGANDPSRRDQSRELGSSLLRSRAKSATSGKELSISNCYSRGWAGNGEGEQYRLSEIVSIIKTNSQKGDEFVFGSPPLAEAKSQPKHLQKTPEFRTRESSETASLMALKSVSQEPKDKSLLIRKRPVLKSILLRNKNIFRRQTPEKNEFDPAISDPPRLSAQTLDETNSLVLSKDESNRFETFKHLRTEERTFSCLQNSSLKNSVARAQKKYDSFFSSMLSTPKAYGVKYHDQEGSFRASFTKLE